MHISSQAANKALATFEIVHHPISFSFQLHSNAPLLVINFCSCILSLGVTTPNVGNHCHCSKCPSPADARNSFPRVTAAPRINGVIDAGYLTRSLLLASKCSWIFFPSDEPRRTFKWWCRILAKIHDTMYARAMTTSANMHAEHNQPRCHWSGSITVPPMLRPKEKLNDRANPTVNPGNTCRPSCGDRTERKRNVPRYTTHTGKEETNAKNVSAASGDKPSTLPLCPSGVRTTGFSNPGTHHRQRTDRKNNNKPTPTQGQANSGNPEFISSQSGSDDSRRRICVVGSI
ncbi:hypothetical protein V1519DRAFT_36505 [Lipomyces tetrasporus]